MGVAVSGSCAEEAPRGGLERPLRHKIQSRQRRILKSTPKMSLLETNIGGGGAPRLISSSVQELFSPKKGGHQMPPGSYIPSLRVGGLSVGLRVGGLRVAGLRDVGGLRVGGLRVGGLRVGGLRVGLRVGGFGHVGLLGGLVGHGCIQQLVAQQFAHAAPVARNLV
jgi:hypothetical protein